MRILGIETSCDETAAAVVENGTKILSNVVASSVELHQKTGGIIPEIAAREQIKCIIPVIEEAIENCKLKIENLDAIAVTVGPGLIGSLLVGVETARTLAYVWQKPIIPVNHLQAHLYANWLNNKEPQLPAIALVVSGGHTDLVLMKDHGKIKWFGGTRDDAAGECFDKTARILGLGYPGGPAIEKAASTIRHLPSTIRFPRPMIEQKNYDFSFSGLKTAVLYESKKVKVKSKKFISLMAKEIQSAIVDCLVSKTIKGAKEHKVKSILLSGGVAANTWLRQELKVKSEKFKMKLFCPEKFLCTDNAAMVASCAYFKLQRKTSSAYFNCKPIFWQKIKANPGLSIEEMV